MNTEFKERLLLALKIRREAVLNGVREEDAPFQKGFKEGLEAAEVIIRALRDPPLIETNVYDSEETLKNCTVQILRNSETGEVSVGWWENG